MYSIRRKDALYPMGSHSSAGRMDLGLKAADGNGLGPQSCLGCIPLLRTPTPACSDPLSLVEASLELRGCERDRGTECGRNSSAAAGGFRGSRKGNGSAEAEKRRTPGRSWTLDNLRAGAGRPSQRPRGQRGGRGQVGAGDRVGPGAPVAAGQSGLAPAVGKARGYTAPPPPRSAPLRSLPCTRGPARYTPTARKPTSARNPQRPHRACSRFPTRKGCDFAPLRSMKIAPPAGREFSLEFLAASLGPPTPEESGYQRLLIISLPPRGLLFRPRFFFEGPKLCPCFYTFSIPYLLVSSHISTWKGGFCFFLSEHITFPRHLPHTLSSSPSSFPFP